MVAPLKPMAHLVAMTKSKHVEAFGTWPSPLTAADIAASGVRYGLCRMDGPDLYWSEFRPDDSPRSVIVRHRQFGGPESDIEGDMEGSMEDVLPAPFSARSKVHEYGGGEFAVHNGCVVFVNDADQDLYRLVADQPPQRLTDAPDWRFADMDLSPDDSQCLMVGEFRDPDAADHMPQNTIVSVVLDADSLTAPDQVLVGRDFYACPRFSPDGKRLAWLAWDLPHMPWEAAELWVADLGPGNAISTPRQIAGGNGHGAFQPQWAPDGDLYFIASHASAQKANGTSWGNLHRADSSGVQVVLADEAEYGRPLWQFGMTSFAVLDTGTIAATCWRDGLLNLGILRTDTGLWTPVETDLARLDNITGGPSGYAILGGTNTSPPGVWRTPDQQTPPSPVTSGRRLLDIASVSVPNMVHVNTSSGPLHALFYPPINANTQGPEKALPPLLVTAHGGPTAMAKRGLDLERQYWTTRGFAILDVDYRGSFGYGHDYTAALDGQWGLLDAADAIAAAMAVADQGLVDPKAMVIAGGSAGGLTVLNALATSKVFAAGASSYGVADLHALARDTHKFEAGYLYSLIGVAADDPKAQDAVFTARSPLSHADKIVSPVIFLQGLDDAVVPPSQSRVIVNSLTERGVPVAYLEFEGEGHGFRNPKNVIRALQATHGFFARILKLDVTEKLPLIDIDNL